MKLDSNTTFRLFCWILFFSSFYLLLCCEHKILPSLWTPFFPLTHNQCVNAFNTVVAKDELFYIYESQWDQVENRPVLPWSILVAFFWSVVVDVKRVCLFLGVNLKTEVTFSVSNVWFNQLIACLQDVVQHLCDSRPVNRSVYTRIHALRQVLLRQLRIRKCRILHKRFVLPESQLRNWSTSTFFFTIFLPKGAKTSAQRRNEPFSNVQCNRFGRRSCRCLTARSKCQYNDSHAVMLTTNPYVHPLLLPFFKSSHDWSESLSFSDKIKPRLKAQHTALLTF